MISDLLVLLVICVKTCITFVICFCWICNTNLISERAIARLKIFQILSFVRHDMYPFINKILVILSYVVNNFPPLLKDDEEKELEEVLTQIEVEEPDVDEFTANDKFVATFAANFDDSDDDITFVN